MFHSAFSAALLAAFKAVLQAVLQAFSERKLCPLASTDCKPFFYSFPKLFILS
jgi:hypothetical protein